MTDPTPEDVERVALLPCPFCGATARYFPDSMAVYCETRGCAGQAALMDEAQAIVTWNRRAAMPDHSALLRELRAALIEAKRQIAEDFAVVEDSYRILFVGHPNRGGFDAEGEAERTPYVAVLAKIDPALRKANEALGEKT